MCAEQGAKFGEDGVEFSVVLRRPIACCRARALPLVLKMPRRTRAFFDEAEAEDLHHVGQGEELIEKIARCVFVARLKCVIDVHMNVHDWRARA